MKAKYIDTFTNDDGELCRRLVLDIPGHDVQIIQYDESTRVCVKLDDDVVMMQIGEIDKYIAARLEQNVMQEYFASKSSLSPWEG